MTSSTPPRPGWTGDVFDTLLLWIVAALAAVAGVAWSGAVVAGVLGGGGTVGLTFPAAAEAVVSLPDHLDDPASAWPEPARSHLPGPVVYWAAQAVAVAGWGVAARQGWRLWGRRTRRRGVLGIETEAGFARRSDLDRLVVRRPQAGRLTLGHAGGRLIAAEPQASLAVLGPSGCGKTAGFAIPALLEWEGPVIVTSVKNDVLDPTLLHRQGKGRAWIYDPVGCSGYPSDLWSPVAGCGSWREALRMAAWMCEAKQPRLDTVTDGDYWYSQARKGLSPYLYAAAVSGRGLSDLVRWIDAREVGEVEAALKDAAEPGGPDGARWDELWQASVETCRDLLRHAGGPVPGYVDAPAEQWPPHVLVQVEETVEAEWRAELEACGHGGDDSLFALGSARALWIKGERLRDSVYATIENVLAEWADPGVRAAGRGSDLDLREWLAGDNTVYVVANAHEQRRLRPVFTVLVQQAIRTAYEVASEQGGRLARPALVLLDEAGNIAPIRDLPVYASTARSHGITLVSIWQDTAQIQAIYEDRARTVLNNHRAKLFGAGIADESTLEYVSRLIGDEYRTERTFAAELDGARRSVSEHGSYRRAAPVDVLRRIPPSEAVLLYGSELPAHVRLRPWFDDRRLRAAAGRPDLVRALDLGRTRDVAA